MSFLIKFPVASTNSYSSKSNPTLGSSSCGPPAGFSAFPGFLRFSRPESALTILKDNYRRLAEGTLKFSLKPRFFKILIAKLLRIPVFHEFARIRFIFLEHSAYLEN